MTAYTINQVSWGVEPTHYTTRASKVPLCIPTEAEPGVGDWAWMLAQSHPSALELPDTKAPFKCRPGLAGLIHTAFAALVDPVAEKVTRLERVRYHVGLQFFGGNLRANDMPYPIVLLNDSQAAESVVAEQVCIEAREESPPAWVHAMYDSVAKESSDDAIDLLFRNVDAMLRRSEFLAAEQALLSIDFSRLNPTLAVGVLTITRAARDSMPRRPELVGRVRLALAGLPEARVARLLTGIE